MLLHLLRSSVSKFLLVSFNRLCLWKEQGRKVHFTRQREEESLNLKAGNQNRDLVLENKTLPSTVQDPPLVVGVRVALHDRVSAFGPEDPEGGQQQQDREAGLDGVDDQKDRALDFKELHQGVGRLPLGAAVAHYLQQVPVLAVGLAILTHLGHFVCLWDQSLDDEEVAADMDYEDGDVQQDLKEVEEAEAEGVNVLLGAVGTVGWVAAEDDASDEQEVEQADADEDFEVVSRELQNWIDHEVVHPQLAGHGYDSSVVQQRNALPVKFKDHKGHHYYDVEQEKGEDLALEASSSTVEDDGPEENQDDKHRLGDKEYGLPDRFLVVFLISVHL